jgi:hypothetical protein
LIKAIREDTPGSEETEQLVPWHSLNVPHNLHRIRFLSPSSLAFTQKRAEGDFTAAPSKADIEALDNSEKEFFERMRKRISIKRINTWLDERGGKDTVLDPVQLIDSDDSYIRFIYALLYSDSRNDFGYKIEEDDEAGSVRAEKYVVPDIKFRRSNT